MPAAPSRDHAASDCLVPERRRRRPTAGRAQRLAPPAGAGRAACTLSLACCSTARPLAGQSLQNLCWATCASLCAFRPAPGLSGRPPAHTQSRGTAVSSALTGCLVCHAHSATLALGCFGCCLVYLFCMPHDAAFGTVSCLAWGPAGRPACMWRWDSRGAHLGGCNSPQQRQPARAHAWLQTVTRTSRFAAARFLCT